MLENLKNLINEKISSANATILSAEAGDQSLEVSAEVILEVCQLLRDNGVQSFNVLQVMTGVDYPDYFEVNYILANFDLEKPAQLILKTKVSDKENPTLQTVTSIWKSADWQERECFDMIGVRFEGHPDHRRILCPDDWEGFPLRKDYKVAKVYRDMEIEPEAKMNWEERNFKDRQDEIKVLQERRAD